MDGGDTYLQIPTVELAVDLDSGFGVGKADRPLFLTTNCPISVKNILG